MTKFDSFAKGVMTRWDEINSVWQGMASAGGLLASRDQLAQAIVYVLDHPAFGPEFARVVEAAKAISRGEGSVKRPLSDAQKASLAKAHAAVRANAARKRAERAAQGQPQ